MFVRWIVIAVDSCAPKLAKAKRYGKDKRISSNQHFNLTNSAQVPPIKLMRSSIHNCSATLTRWRCRRTRRL